MLVCQHIDLYFQKPYFFLIPFINFRQSSLNHLQCGRQLPILDQLIDSRFPELSLFTENFQRKLQSSVKLVVLLAETFSVFEFDHLSHQSLAVRQFDSVLIKKSSCLVRFFLLLVQHHVFLKHVKNFLLSQTITD
jgi:hypothetical protein